MSSRALRKLQRQREEADQAQLNQNDSNDQKHGDGQSVSDDDLPVSKGNAFDFLNAADGVEDEEDDEDEPHATENQQHARNNDLPSNAQSSQVTKKRRKKSKAKKKAPTESIKPGQATKSEPISAEVDEIDQALAALGHANSGAANKTISPAINAQLKDFYDLLAADPKHLDALNEMKKLFGSDVVQNQNDQGPDRRRMRGPQTLDLSAALTARWSPVSKGQGLSGVALRRNALLPGKAEWPKATSEGLGMELIERAWDFTVEYCFVHSQIYRQVQQSFDRCVEMMEPQNLIDLLQYHPYHISTLLQVSEIAKHQGDQSVAGDLLERALFTFGRSVQSSFPATLAEGKVRLDFRRFENREFWLAAWRHIASLGQRGTWRTAFEWAKLLLSLDPEDDPYCIRLILDQLAIRGGQYELLIKLADVDPEVINWGQDLPNVRISLALAHYKLRHHEQCRTVLRDAVARWPWIFSMLFSELNIESTPKAIWGTQPRTKHEEFLQVSYATRAKDLWNVPEALSLLVEVVETSPRADPPEPDKNRHISLNEARHAILSDIPKLITLIPRELTNRPSTSSDPIPPDDDFVANQPSQQDQIDEASFLEEENDNAESQPGATGLVARTWNWLTGAPRVAAGTADAAQGPSAEDSEPTDGQEQESSALNTSPTETASTHAVPPNSNNNNGENDGTDEESEVRLLRVTLREFAGIAANPELRPRASEYHRLPLLLNLLQPVTIHHILSRLRDMTLEEAQALDERYPNERRSPDEMANLLTRYRELLASATNNAPESATTNAPASSTMTDGSDTDEETVPNTSPRPAASQAEDPQAAQRWLAGRGMQQVKDYVAAHGLTAGSHDVDAGSSDQHTSKPSGQDISKSSGQDDAKPSEQKNPIDEYAVRLRNLEPRSQRDFILNYALPQGAGREIAQLIRQRMET